MEFTQDHMTTKWQDQHFNSISLPPKFMLLTMNATAPFLT